MRRPKHEFDPNSATVEHIVPLSIGGDNKTDGQFPNCIPMCHACNQARNKVVLKFGKSIGVVKFLIEQVYCKGVRLAEKYSMPSSDSSVEKRVGRQRRSVNPWQYLPLRNR